MKRLIQKLLGKDPQIKEYKNDSKEDFYYLTDIYFAINFEKQEIIPFIFNQDYNSIQRLDTMEIVKHNSNIKHKLDDFEYTPTFINKSTELVSDIYLNRNYYSFNYMALKLLFAQNCKNFTELDSMQILNIMNFDLKYNLIRKFNFIKKFRHSSTSYVSKTEILKIVDYVKNSKIFKGEIGNYNNSKILAKSRIF